MPKYVVTYHGSGSPAPEEMQEAMAAFGVWLGANQALVTDAGAPCRPVDQVASGTPEPMAAIGGYSILEGSLEDVLAALSTHPFVGRGGTLQLNEAVTPPS